MNASKLKTLTAAAARLGLQLAVASVPGRDHQLAGRPNQDAWGLAVSERHLAAVVSDGCGSAPHSELGAHLAAQWTAEALVAELDTGHDGLSDELFERARRQVLRKLESLQGLLSGPAREAVHDHLLFTLVGVALGPHVLRTFSIGDGALAIDGFVNELGPFEGNRPPYLGYALLPEATHGLTCEQLRWRLDPPRDRASVGSVSLATDGALVRTSGLSWSLSLDGQMTTGAPLRLGGLFTALHRGDHFRNPDSLRRALWLEARAAANGAGHLADDTTILSLRAIDAAPPALSA